MWRPGIGRSKTGSRVMYKYGHMWKCCIGTEYGQLEVSVTYINDR